jgi:hypothetical protein
MDDRYVKGSPIIFLFMKKIINFREFDIYYSFKLQLPSEKIFDTFFGIII